MICQLVGVTLNRCICWCGLLTTVVTSGVGSFAQRNFKRVMRSRRSHGNHHRAPHTAAQRRRKRPSTCWKRSLRFDCQPDRVRSEAVATGTPHARLQTPRPQTGTGGTAATEPPAPPPRARAPPPTAAPTASRGGRGGSVAPRPAGRRGRR